MARIYIPKETSLARSLRGFGAPGVKPKISIVPDYSHAGAPQANNRDFIMLFDERGGSPHFYINGKRKPATVDALHQGWIPDGYDTFSSSDANGLIVPSDAASGDWRAAITIVVQFKGRTGQSSYERIFWSRDNSSYAIRGNGTYLQILTEVTSIPLASFLDDQWHTFVFSRSGGFTESTLNAWFDGERIFTNQSHNLTADWGSTTYPFILGNGSGLSNRGTATSICCAVQRVLPETLCRDLSIDPWQLSNSVNQSPFLVGTAAASGVTGDLSAQESGGDTASVTGTVLIDGDLSAQESGADTAALVGTVSVAGTLVAQESGADTAVFTGEMNVQGDLSAVEVGSDTGVFMGEVLVAGTLSVQEAGSDTAAFTGDASEDVIGDLSVQETGSDTSVITGTVHVSGTLSVQESGSDTASITGSVGEAPISGTLVVQETGTDACVVLGSVLVVGSMSVQESGSDTASITGSVVITGALSAQESGGDTASFTGYIPNMGTLVATETGGDTAYFSEEAPDIIGDLVATETGGDTARFFGECVQWSRFSKAQARLNASTLRVFGEPVILDSSGVATSVKAVLVWPDPDVGIGNTDYRTPQPYLMFRTKDVSTLTIAARQKVIVRGKEFTVVSDPRDDESCMTIIDIRGAL